MYAVLITEGKHDSVDWATVMLFKTKAEAEECCREHTTPRQKYWQKAEIVGHAQRIELCQIEE